MSLDKFLKQYEQLKFNFTKQKIKLAVDSLIVFYASKGKKRGQLIQCAQTISKSFDVFPNSLLSAYRRKINQTKKWHASRLLNENEESLLVKKIIERDAKHEPLTRSDIIGLVCDLKRKSEIWDGSSWFRRFIERNHNQLQNRIPKPIVPERVSNEIIEQIQAFIEDFVEFRRYFSETNGDTMINCDETRVDSVRIGRNVSYITSKHNKNPTIIQERSRMSMSILSFVIESGLKPFTVYVYPKKRIKPNSPLIFQVKKIKNRINRSTRYEATTYTKSGWVSKAVWIKSISEFCRLSKEFLHNRKAVLLMDRLPSHKHLDSINCLKKNGIEAIFLPVKTSHFLQPLDQFIVAAFKNYVGKSRRQKKNNGKLMEKDKLKKFEDAITKGIDEYITSSIIKKSWNITGLYPWNKTLIQTNLQKNLGLKKNELENLMKIAEESKSL